MGFQDQLRAAATNFASGGAGTEMTDPSDMSGIYEAFQNSEAGQTIGKMVGASGADLSEVLSTLGAATSIRVDSAAGKDPRTQVYDALMESDKKLGQDKLKLIKDMAQDNPMSKSQVAAMMLIGVMPALIGGIVKGKTGVGVGAEAGGLGAQVMAKGIEKDQAQERIVKSAELKSIDSQLESNSETRNKLMIDQLNNADKAKENELDRENSRANAEIRAGGDKAGLIAIGRMLENSKKQSEDNARNKAFQSGPYVYMPKGAVRDKDVDEVRELGMHYDILDKKLEQMVELNNSLGAPALESQFGNPESKFNMLRTDALKSLEAIKKVPGTMGNAGLEKLDKMITEPAKFWSRLYASTLGADTSTALTSLKNSIKEDAEIFLRYRDIAKVPIGDVRYKDNTPYYLLGTDENGKLVYTPDKNKLNEQLKLYGRSE